MGSLSLFWKAEFFEGEEGREIITTDTYKVLTMNQSLFRETSRIHSLIFQRPSFFNFYFCFLVDVADIK